MQDSQAHFEQVQELVGFSAGLEQQQLLTRLCFLTVLCLDWMSEAPNRALVNSIVIVCLCVGGVGDEMVCLCTEKRRDNGPYL